MKINRRIITTGITLLVLLGIIGSLGRSIPAAAQGSGPQIQVDSQVLESLQAGEPADFIIVMGEQADLNAAYHISDWDERGWYVYNTLKETAARSQKRTIEQLERRGVSYESFIAGNEIYVHGGTQQALNAVLDLGDAAQVRAPVSITLEPAGARLFSQPPGPQPPAAVQQAEVQAVVSNWGLQDTGAPEFWSAYGRQGEGIIVANIDTGVQYDHPALANSYRCRGSSLYYTACWRDTTTSVITTVPYDDHGHGTHTMGTMVGITITDTYPPYTTYEIGMAPQAQWIACKAFDSTGWAGEIELNDCANWILAPGGNPSNRPHVVNNSWGGGQSDPWFRSKVQAWAAAGIFPVFSAGNLESKSSCVLMGSPADYPESFTVGAHSQSGFIAYFSLNGSDGIQTTSTLKPNLSAPGVYVLSAYKDFQWDYLKGTSMAAPHVSGAVALLWSCNPALRGQIDETYVLLENSAAVSPDGSCGAPDTGDGNYTYGHGYLDVYTAGAGTCIDWLETYLPVIRR